MDQHARDSEGMGTIKQRGVLAGIAALAVTVVVQREAEPVGATDGTAVIIGVTGNLLSPITNVGNTKTGLLGNTPFTGDTVIEFDARGAGGDVNGVIGDASGAGAGVVHRSSNGQGVAGVSNSGINGHSGGYFATTANFGSGVVGQTFASSGAAAFVGQAPSITMPPTSRARSSSLLTCKRTRSVRSPSTATSTRRASSPPSSRHRRAPAASSMAPSPPMRGWRTSVRRN